MSWDRDTYGDDTMTREGAYDLKAKIERYWAKRGQHVTTYLVNAPFSSSARTAPICVRSDMLNGLPRQMVKARAA